MPRQLHAQEPEPADTLLNAGFDPERVVDHTHMITMRIYNSTKFNSFSISDRSTGADGGNTLTYQPNNQVNLGVGASYRALTLNLGFGFGFLNKDDAVKGTTNYFDAQGNLFAKTLATNLFFQRYRGYYIDGIDKALLGWEVPSVLPYRSDVVQSNIGLSTLYIFNNDRFSYRAAFNQDSWQRRSAGSFLAGGYATYYTIRADSSLVPAALSALYDSSLYIRRGDFVDAGPMGGYAHTFVIARHVFITLSYVVGVGLSTYRTTVSLPGGVEATERQVSAGFHGQGRSALGYNGSRFTVALTYNLENVNYSIGTDESFQWNVGNVRFNVAWRIDRRIKLIDRVLERLPFSVG
ncbi:MAG: DUF4421 domain-containing protein [Flavobacteriales bacterium]|nr:DUF4421 domain-containing protein [Flavobacteriales bacterium]